MKRIGGLFVHVVSFDNLIAAARRAARGKSASPEVAAFLYRLEPAVLQLERELTAGSYRPGPYRTFTIREPKLRQITVAPFRDRVVHHAVCGVLEPRFEHLFIHDSYACRRGKGTLRAVRRAQAMCRRHGLFLKLDVRSYFHSVDHDVLVRFLQRRIKDARLLALLESVVRHPVPNCPAGRGLPIGNLTSQHLANFYLNALDQHVLNEIGPGGYLRYMDDMVLFGDEKDRMWRWRDRIEDFLADVLRLHLKAAATLLAPTWQGLPFLGRRVYPRLVRVRRENLRRSLRLWKRRRWAAGRQRISSDDLARSAGALFSLLAQADSLRLRQDIVAARGGDQGRMPGTGSNRVKRGGNWNNNAQNCRSAQRNNNNPNNSNNNIGFRSVNSRHRREVGVQGHRPRAQGQDQAVHPVPARAGRR